LKLLESMLADETSAQKLSKKELLDLDREREKLEKSLGGIKAMSGVPDALFVIDVGHEYIAVAEANRLGIPVVGVVDSNCKPDGVDYVIPGNDDAIRAIRLYAQSAADAVVEGASQREIAVSASDDEFVEVKDETAKVKVLAKKRTATGEVTEESEADSAPKAKRKPRAGTSRGKKSEA